MINCIIIEDEPIAMATIQDYISKIPVLNLIDSFQNALDSLETLENSEIDLVFLDIHLPKIKGLDFLKSIKNPPQVILTTAHHDYAVESYELDVLDYLLKPYSFDRFLSSVQKCIFNNMKSKNSLDHIIVNSENKKHRIQFSDIQYVESEREYSTFHLKERKIKVKLSLSQVENLLDSQRFIRIHKSYITSIDKILSFNQSYISLDEKNIPIGKKYKDSFNKRLDFFHKSS